MAMMNAPHTANGTVSSTLSELLRFCGGDAARVEGGVSGGGVGRWQDGGGVGRCVALAAVGGQGTPAPPAESPSTHQPLLANVDAARPRAAAQVERRPDARPHRALHSGHVHVHHHLAARAGRRRAGW
jgi:hypothetical protein